MRQVIENQRPCGAHANQYMLFTDIGAREVALFPVYGLERARELAARLSGYHEVRIQDLSTGAIVASAVVVEPVSVEDLR